MENMLFPLVVVYALTLLYAAICERFRHYAVIVGVQGFLLFAIALLQLGAAGENGHAGAFERGFVVAETVLFKGVLIPFLLLRIIRRTRINRVSFRALPPFFSLLMSIMALIASLAITAYVADSRINAIFFGVSLFGILMGMILIISRVKVFSHLVGFLIIENSVFLFSLAVGATMPLLINLGILLDILMGVLMLGMFVSKINDRFKSLDTDELSNLKD